MKKILIVDDEPDILEFLKYNLIKENFHCYTSKDGLEAIEIAKNVIPDLIILDVMLSNLDGFETCRRLKEIDVLKKTFIIFLTARFEDYNQVEGLNAGADDYIVKPIKLGILISKIKAFFRREDHGSSDVIYVKDLVINKTSYTLIRNSIEINLSNKEFEILYLLLSKPKKVFSRDEIYSKIWGNQIKEGNRTIDVHIRQIRKKAGEDLIVTVKRIGYKFE